MQLPHHTVHLLNHACIGGSRPYMLDHTQHQQPDFQGVQALAAEGLKLLGRLRPALKLAVELEWPSTLIECIRRP